MKKLALCVVLTVVVLGASVSTAFAAVGSYTSVVATKSGNNIVGTGRSYNMVSDMTTVYDVTYRHWARGYSLTSTDYAASSGKTGAYKPFYIYVKSKVLYASWHLPGILVTGYKTAETANSGAYTTSIVRAPSNSSTVLEGWCDGGIPRYAYTSGTHSFRYNSAATLYTWGTYTEIRNPNFP